MLLHFVVIYIISVEYYLNIGEQWMFKFTYLLHHVENKNVKMKP
jgi:hypothetical protein